MTFFLIVVYYVIVNVIFFAPLSYSVKEGEFSLTSTDTQIIHEQWTRKVTVEIELTSGGPLLLIHTVISDDFTEEITSLEPYQSKFQTWRISLSTWGTNATHADGTYKIIDHTSPLLPKAESPYTTTLEIYLHFLLNATFLLLGVLFIIFVVISLFIIIKNRKSINWRDY